MKFADRLLTIIITATLTSAIWIVFGGTFRDMATERQTGGDLASAQADTAQEDPGGFEAPESIIPAGIDSGEAPPPASDGTGEAQRAGSNALMIPVRGTEPGELSDTFYDNRGGGSRLHEAIDIMADEGTDVIAAAPGTIAKLHKSGPGGNSIYVRSGDRKTIYYYAHLAEYASGLREGQSIRAGQRLGTVGSTGNADPAAPHLHFSIMETTADADWWEPSNPVNPYPLLTQAAQ